MKKVFLFILSILFTFSLCGCSSGKDTGTIGFTINPDLETALGKEWVKSNADTIDDLVSELRDCYKQYQKDNDTYAFGTKIEEIYNSHESFFNDVHDSIADKSEASSSGYYEDLDFELKIMTLSLQECLLFIPNSWTLEMSLMEIGPYPGTEATEPNWEELATDLIDFINKVSVFFYCEPIAE